LPVNLNLDEKTAIGQGSHVMQNNLTQPTTDHATRAAKLKQKQHPPAVSNAVLVSVRREGQSESRPFAAVERVAKSRWQFVRLNHDGTFKGRERVRDLVEGINYAIRLANGAGYYVDSIGLVRNWEPK
jgi:hypothetical protein